MECRIIDNSPSRTQGGFSLIEVLIALVVLGVGLLGLGLLQTMNLRYTQSANQRTVATNMASELLDTIRTNRSVAATYAMDESNFSAVTVDNATGCGTMANLSATENVTRWRCEIREKLGPDAYARVVVAMPQVTVSVFWKEANMPNPVSGDEGQVTMGTTL